MSWLWPWPHRQRKDVITAAVAAAVERMDEHASKPDSWLEQRRAARERNADAETRSYVVTADLGAEGDRLAKEASRELLRVAGVTDETFERAWSTNP